MFSNRKIVLLIVFLIVLSISAYMLLVAIPTRIAERSYEGAKKIGEDIRKAFQFTPEITVNNTVVVQQQTEILELATLAQTFQHQYEWTNRWMGSTKKINIKGTFEAKAGFNLYTKFSINIDGDKAFVVLPEPELLSLTPHGDVIFQDEQGVWNWVNAEDRSKAMNAFTQDAARYAKQADFIQQARRNMESRMREILALHGKEVIIRYEDQQRITPR